MFRQKQKYLLALLGYLCVIWSICESNLERSPKLKESIEDLFK
jgi:hypothetical protein